MNKDKLLMLLRFLGIAVFIIGAFAREWLPDDKEYISLMLMVIGIATNLSAVFQTKIVYVCPVCKTQFNKPKGEIVLTAGTRRSALKASLLTCPCCKKTNFCMGKRVAKEKEKEND